jgi:hypothetical protein
MIVEDSNLELPENRVLDFGDHLQNIVKTVRDPLVALDSTENC